MQEIQVSHQEDTEAGDADPLIIKEGDEKYETQGEAQEEETPLKTKCPGREREGGSWEGPLRKDQSFQAGEPERGGVTGGREPVKARRRIRMGG